AAVSSGDNSNILSARVVRETFDVTNVVARIYDQGRAEVYERLGIPSVATVRWAADQVMRRLLPTGSEPLWRDPSGTVRLVEVFADVGWVGKRISQMETLAHARIPFLVRFGTGIVTNETTVLQDGDLIYAAVANDQVGEIEELFAKAPGERG
ncbi:MAG: TrkA family potassium uptake protein, partial [Propionibacteriaceae bacterium]|nr:TrkA family potassium uptake protein [Propionibacteriaceae bacterium]